MAEAFGVAAGAVGIAAIFSTCVECFDYIQVGRRFGKDFQTKLLTLSLLKLRLSRWGEAVHIYDDPKLGHPEATKADVELAKNTLYQILMLLADSEKVSNKFRLTAKPGEDLSALTSADMETTIVALDNKTRKQAARRQKSASLLKLTSWALYDQEHSSSLIDDIVQLLDLLERVFPAPEIQTTLAEAEVKEVSDGTKDQQASTLKLLQELATGIDNVLKTKAAVVMATQGFSIGSLVTEDNARVKDGNFYSSSWKGEMDLPKSNANLTVGSIRAGGNSRVMNGDTYGDKDDFWD